MQFEWAVAWVNLNYQIPIFSSMKKNILLSAILLITCYSSNAQSWDWAKNVDYFGRDIGNSIGTDALNNIYITGTSVSSSSQGTGHGYSMFWKFDNSGNMLFQDTLKTEGVYKSVTDTNGNTYIIGQKIAKYNSFGQMLWLINNTFGYSIALNPLGGIVIVGTVSINNDTKSALALYDENGNIVWTKIDEFPRGSTNLICDKYGNTYVVGAGYIDSITGNSGFLVKYDSNGVLLSNRTIPHWPNDIEIDDKNNIYIAGWFSPNYPISINGNIYHANNSNLRPQYLIKYDQLGNVLWYKIFTGGYLGNSAIATDKKGNVYLSVDYMSLNVDNINLSSNSKDIFVMKTDSTGNILWFENSIAGSSPANASSNDIIVNSDDEVLITGAVDGSHSFGAYILTQNSMYSDMLVAKIGLGITTNTSAKPMQLKEFNVLPNPGQGMFQISYKAHETKELQINVFNNSGIKVYSENSANPQKELTKNIDLSKEAKGTYYIELIADGKKSVKKVILN